MFNFTPNQQTSTAPLFGGATNTSSPFGSTQTATPTSAPLFGSSASTATTSNSLFGATPASTTTTPSLFGNASTGATSVPTFGNALNVPSSTSSLFGSGAASSLSTASPFGSSTATSKPATTTSLFGAANTATQPSAFSFGSATAAAPTPAFTSAPFGSATTAPVAEAKSVTDGSVPHYTIGPHSIMRQTAPPPPTSSSFLSSSQKDVDTKLSAPDTTSKSHNPTFQDKRTVLPGFLTSIGSSSKSEASTQIGGDRNVKSSGATSSNSSSGLFSSTGQDYGYGSRSQTFDASDDSEAPPMLSMWEIGVHQPAPTAFPARPLSMGLSWNSPSNANKVGAPTSGVSGTTNVYASDVMQPPTATPSASFGQSTFGSSNSEYSSNFSESDQATINVCGFPPSMTSYILDHFRQYGEILDYRNSGSNWMTITYSTRLSAQKALSRNGKVIGGNCMIGVSPANQQNVFGTVASPELVKDDKSTSKPLVGRPIQVDRTGQIWRSSGLGSGRAGPSATNANGQNNKATNVVGGVIAHAKDALFAW